TLKASTSWELSRLPSGFSITARSESTNGELPVWRSDGNTACCAQYTSIATKKP
ncbi:hypothetical protein LTR28_013170, partial [Elasticomyces elasticus]